MSDWILPLKDLTLENLAEVGTKNAYLGEMLCHLSQQGVLVPDGFAITALAYRDFLVSSGLQSNLEQLLTKLDTEHDSNLRQIGMEARSCILHAQLPERLQQAIAGAYQQLRLQDPHLQLAVRSSLLVKELPDVSFAGQQESYLNIRSLPELIEACLNCYASLFSEQTIKYQAEKGFWQVGLSICVQKMVRSDQACAGVCFTIDPETGFDRVILISGNWGLGENVSQGSVNPDEFYVFKPLLHVAQQPIISRKLGSKTLTMVYADDDAEARRHRIGISHTVNLDTPKSRQNQYVLQDNEVIQLAQWCQQIEKHFCEPMSLEWAKDGISGELYIVQASPESVHSRARHIYQYHVFALKNQGEILVQGRNIGSRIVTGRARILNSPSQREQLEPGDILVTKRFSPDWGPILQKVAAIVTDKGGRTSHEAIIARENGVVAVVGTGNGTHRILDGQEVTVSCIDGQVGQVYSGKLCWDETVVDISQVQMPVQTEARLIVANPNQAFKLAQLPSLGVGLMRLEFVIKNHIKIHPLALIHFPNLLDLDIKRRIDALTHNYEDKPQFYIDKLSEAVATFAAAFHPRDVMVRMSDFTSHAYARLIGGSEFEPHEKIPLMGMRGAARYGQEPFRQAFRLECLAMKRVRDDMGLSNVKLLIPFCRTLREADAVLETMADFGLNRGENGLEIHMVCEIPANVILAANFATRFDGFSIGSNDLTQLTLGIDRDSELMMNSFDEQDLAIKRMIKMLIQAAHLQGIKVGICGQAPSDDPSFARFLVEAGIDSVSFNPDALMLGLENIVAAEKVEPQRTRSTWLRGFPPT